MKSILSKVLILAVGAAIGSAVTYELVYRQCMQMADDEINEMREYYEKKYKTDDSEDSKVEEKEEPEEPAKVNTQKPSLQEYAAKIKDLQYDEENEEEEGDDMNTEPYVISPDEFGEKYDHDPVSLTYYSDSVLTDDWDEVIQDPEALVGEDFASHFGEYEDDSVFIRNDKLKKDYEILLDHRKFSEIAASKEVD